MPEQGPKVAGKPRPEKTMELGDGDLEELADAEGAGAVTVLPGGGRYVDVGEIGSGGTARIHRVRDEWVQRSVAMKILAPEMTKDPRLVARFVEEAQIQAQLDHPNVAPMHELVVEPGGSAFFTMKLVRGTSLADWLEMRTRPVGSPDRLADGLAIFLKVCDAVAFAHSKGVLHRDLKTENVMLGEFGEVYVVDWGIAVARGGAVAVRTRSGAGRDGYLAGTPGYMSPEAARGEPCDERCDVFGLGAILYGIVAGAHVYGEATAAEALARAREGDVRLSDEAFARSGAPRKLARIVEKALAPDREDRIPTVAALQTEVHKFLRGGLTMPRRSYPAGAQIIVEGEPGDQAFIVLDGVCEVYRTVKGKRRTIGTLGPGDVFGETAVLSDSPRTATVEALDPVTVLVLDRATIEDGLGFDTWLGKLVKALARRFRELDAQAKAR
jgi:serine/threonine-protein kinase